MKGYYLKWGVTILWILSVILFCFAPEQFAIFVLMINICLAMLRGSMSIFYTEKHEFEKEYCKYDKALNDFGSDSLRVSQIKDELQFHSVTKLLSMSCIIIFSLMIVALASQVNWSELFTNLWCFVSSLIEKFPLFEF